MPSIIIFDFDGVIVDSNEVRMNGFIRLYQNRYPWAIDEYRRYLRLNSGLSRYKKIEYFYENILRIEPELMILTKDAEDYSSIVKSDVIKAPFINGFIDFIKKNINRFEYAMISSSNQLELIKICMSRDIDKYFTEILGSPIEKNKNIERFIRNKNAIKSEIVYVGDTKYDEIAALNSGISFIGFGQKSEFSQTEIVVNTYAELEKILL